MYRSFSFKILCSILSGILAFLQYQTWSSHVLIPIFHTGWGITTNTADSPNYNENETTDVLGHDSAALAWR